MYWIDQTGIGDLDQCRKYFVVCPFVRGTILYIYYSFDLSKADAMFLCAGASQSAAH